MGKRRNSQEIQKDIDNQKAKIERYKIRITNIEEHMKILNARKVKVEEKEELQKNGIDLKIASCVQTKGVPHEYLITTDDGLKFLNVRSVKPGTSYRVTKVFHEQLQQILQA